MSAALQALALAEQHGITIALAGDFIRWRSQGPTPHVVLDALKTAKPELLAILRRYSLDANHALAGDDLLISLAKLGFRVRRYGLNAALDDESGLGRVPPMPLIYAFADKQAEYALALRALRAPDRLSEIVNSHDADEAAS